MKYCKMYIILLIIAMMNFSAKAEEVTCQEQELNNVQILVGHPGINAPYLPRNVLVFKCTDVSMKMYGQRAIECQSNGEWDYPYPKCLKTTCVANLANLIIEGCPHPGVVYKPGDRLKVSCVQGLILQGPDVISCQEDGQWSSPFPSCVVETTCGPPPDMSHLSADTTKILDPKETKYALGVKVEYTCFNRYKMEGEPFLICHQGKWTVNFRCIQPCLASVDEMDIRNIQIINGGRTKLFCPHKDHLTFVCQQGKTPKRNSVPFRQECLYGKMTLPECE